MKIEGQEVYTKQPRIVDEFLPFLTGRGTCIQAGAHVGVWPDRICTEFKRVVSFEPAPDSWLVSRKIATSPNVMILNGALGAQRGITAVGQGMKPFDGSRKIVDPSVGYPVACYTIDDLPEWIRNDIDAIVLDIEGYELEALAGAELTIARRRPLLVLEDGEKLRDGLFDLLKVEYEIVAEAHRDIILKAKPPK